MDTALIVIGLFLVGMLIMWIFAFLSDPKEIDEQEEAVVREVPPKQIERAVAEEDAAKDAQRRADEIEFYSPGDTNGG
jgi:hypothetical protein